MTTQPARCLSGLAAEPGRRGEVLRREGLYSSHLVEWRRARAAGALAGLAATRGRPPADPVERDNARLRERNAKLEVKLDIARRVIEVQGRVWALCEPRMAGCVCRNRAHGSGTLSRVSDHAAVALRESMDRWQ